MELSCLVENIQNNCEKTGITITQLEDACKFSHGSIKKWSMSAPASSKVVTVAEYFGISIDELCGVKNTHSNMAFAKDLVYATEEGKLQWKTRDRDAVEALDLFDDLPEEQHLKAYKATLNSGEKQLFLYLFHFTGKTKLYCQLEDGRLIKQNVNSFQLKELYEKIVFSESELQKKFIKEAQQALKEMID